MGIKATAQQFFDACETGKGWAVCQQYCHPSAAFSAQAGALANINTLEAYTDWMKGLFTPVPDGSYEVRSFAVDEHRNNVAAYGVFRGTHTGEGGPVPPTGKKRRGRLRLCHGVRRRQDPPHDEDLERRHQPEADGLDVAPRSHHVHSLEHHGRRPSDVRIAVLGQDHLFAGPQADLEGVLFSLDRWLITAFERYSIADVGYPEHVRRVLACRS